MSFALFYFVDYCLLGSFAQRLIANTYSCETFNYQNYGNIHGCGFVYFKDIPWRGNAFWAWPKQMGKAVWRHGNPVFGPFWVRGGTFPDHGRICGGYLLDIGNVGAYDQMGIGALGHNHVRRGIL